MRVIKRHTVMEHARTRARQAHLRRGVAAAHVALPRRKVQRVREVIQLQGGGVALALRHQRRALLTGRGETGGPQATF
jgi:hypothetical protein